MKQYVNKCGKEKERERERRGYECSKREERGDEMRDVHTREEHLFGKRARNKVGIVGIRHQKLGQSYEIYTSG